VRLLSNIVGLIWISTNSKENVEKSALENRDYVDWNFVQKSLSSPYAMAYSIMTCFQ